MDDKKKAPPEAPNEQRRDEFAPHQNPKKQGDGDPGPRSTTERAVDQSGAEPPETVEDNRTEN